MRDAFGVSRPDVIAKSRKGDRERRTAVGGALGAAGGAGLHRGGTAAAVFGNRFKYKKAGPDKPSGFADFMADTPDRRPPGQKPARWARPKKLVEQRHRLTNAQNKALKAHKAKWGIPSTGFDSSIPAKTYIGFNRSLPKDIPGTRVPRIVAHIGAGKTGQVVRGATAIAGAAAGASAASALSGPHRRVRKSAGVRIEKPFSPGDERW